MVSSCVHCHESVTLASSRSIDSVAPNKDKWPWKRRVETLPKCSTSTELICNYSLWSHCLTKNLCTSLAWNYQINFNICHVRVAQKPFLFLSILSILSSHQLLCISSWSKISFPYSSDIYFRNVETFHPQVVIYIKIISEKVRIWKLSAKSFAGKMKVGRNQRFVSII